MNNKIVKEIFQNYEKNLKIIETDLYTDDLMKESAIEYMNIDVKEMDKSRREVILRDILYLRLNEKEKYMINERYVNKTKPDEIAHSLYFSVSTYHRKMNAIFDKLGEYLEELNHII